MSVLNKSNHPVFVKRVSVETWSLRTEIEAKLATLIEANDEKEIEKTKVFYSDLKTRGLEPLPSLKLAEQVQTEPDKESEEKPEDKKASEDEEKSDDKEAADKTVDEKNIAADTDSNAKEAEQVEDTPFVRVYPESSERNKGFIFLAEVNMQEVLFFSKETYLPGQNIIIEFHVTKKFTMCVEVIKSVGVTNKSKIISDKKPSYRILADFKFYFQGERENLRNFLKSVEPDIPLPPKKIARPKEEDADDGVDLEDLGF
jgi:hypothetical protein